MPFVRIELPNSLSPERARKIADAIHEAMVATIDIPFEDRFQVIAQRPAEFRIFDRTYLGVIRSDACIFVQITLKSGRSADQKRALYHQVASNLETQVGLQSGDVMIILIENEPIDWSFGNGEAQIEPVSIEA